MQNKRCARCGCAKPLAAFAWRWQAAGVRDGVCRGCRRRAKGCRGSGRESTGRFPSPNAARASSQQTVRAYLAHKQCADCGAADPRLLDFDCPRRNLALRAAAIATSGWPRGPLLVALLGWEVRCANCLRRKYPRSPFENSGTSC